MSALYFLSAAPLRLIWALTRSVDHHDALDLFFQVGEYENAIQEFQERIDMGGWYEERFQARLDQGRAMIMLGRDPSEMFKAAYDMCPWRAEPLFELSMWHDSQQKLCQGAEPWATLCSMQHRVAGYVLAQKAADLPLPVKDALFIWHDIYDYRAKLWEAVHAYYIADFGSKAMEAGHNISRTLATRFPRVELHVKNAGLFQTLAREAAARAAGLAA